MHSCVSCVCYSYKIGNAVYYPFFFDKKCCVTSLPYFFSVIDVFFPLTFGTKFFCTVQHYYIVNIKCNQKKILEVLIKNKLHVYGRTSFFVPWHGRLDVHHNHWPPFLFPFDFALFPSIGFNFFFLSLLNSDTGRRLFLWW